ncbi:MAG TPA: hypothetical protein VF175_05470 [Lacipirellula sp.]
MAHFIGVFILKGNPIPKKEGREVTPETNGSSIIASQFCFDEEARRRSFASFVIFCLQKPDQRTEGRKGPKE